MRKTAFVFPGQGSQVVGMGKALADSVPEAARVFDRAEEITGLPIRKLCFEGPMEELTRTAHLQPCLTAVEIACCQAVRQSGLEAAAVAGHSLGEYPALWAAGILSLEDTLRLVMERGRLMDEGARKNPGAMAAVVGLARQDLEALMNPLTARGALSLANHNSPEQIVITGESELVSALCAEVKASGARAIPLKVTGAFHSPMMREAAQAFSAALSAASFRAPKIAFYSNVTAEREADPDRIRALMAEQICSPVRWYDIVRHLAEAGVENFMELGPKRVLSNLIAKSLPDNAQAVTQIEDPQGLEDFLKNVEDDPK